MEFVYSHSDIQYYSFKFLRAALLHGFKANLKATSKIWNLLKTWERYIWVYMLFGIMFPLIDVDAPRVAAGPSPAELRRMRELQRRSEELKKLRD